VSLVGAGVLGLACVLVLSACGSSSAAPAPTTTSTLPTTTSGSGTTPAGTTPAGTTAAASAFAAYRSCLQSHGDTSTFGAGGFFGRGGGAGFGATGTTATTTPASTTPRRRPVVSAADQKAIAACASLRPTGGFGRAGAGGFGGGNFSSTNPAFQKFAACLKSHGVKTSTTPGAAGRAGANPSAFAACRSDLPAGSFGRGAGGFPGGGGSGSPGGSTGGPSSSTFAAYQACLKSHGVQTGATNQSASKIASAQAACASILHSGSSTTPATTTSG
jgi:hypothetical protein